MFKLILTFILTNFMVEIYIQPTGAEDYKPLPLVIFEMDNKFYLPEEIETEVMTRGEIVGGTKFSHRGSSQMPTFYCPKPGSSLKCLFPVPREFNYGEPLKCTEEPTPEIIKVVTEVEKCGFQDEGITYYMVYQICEEREIEYIKSSLQIYRFCFHEQYCKTLFTSHHILAPKLLKKRSLLKEREVQYTLIPNNTRNANQLQESLISEIDRNHKPERSQYRIQKLVPSEDMAFANWRKTTYQFLNADLQHNYVFPVWNEMNEKIRDEAIKQYDNDIEFHIKTGIFDVPLEVPYARHAIHEHGDGELIYNVWIKMIISSSWSDNSQKAGVAILVNNFINISKNEVIMQIQNKITEYCPENLCENNFIDKFTKYGVIAICCHTNEKIRNLFGLEFIDLPLLHIPDVVKKPN